jgi:hypothetical protein
VVQTKRSSKKTVNDGLRFIGTFRVQMGENTPDGKIKIVGDSGWRKNQIVNLGWQDYIMATIGKLAGSKQITDMAIGTGTAPASNGTDLNGETGTRVTTANATVGSFTLRCTGEWASGSHPGGTPSIANLGLFNTSAAGTLMCGNTFDSSAWNSNQGVSCTYEIQKA